MQIAPDQNHSTQNSMNSKNTVSTHNASSTTRSEVLGFLEAYDAKLNCDFAFAAYKETDRSGDWRLRINSPEAGETLFEGDEMRKRADEAAAFGETSIVWRRNLTPDEDDTRSLLYRLRVVDGKPAAMDVRLQVRKFDGTPADPKFMHIDLLCA